MSGPDHLWATWRARYVKEEAGRAPDSLFEDIERSEMPDEETYIVWRGETCFALLNIYPYCSGHLLVLPKRAVTELDDLSDEEHAELWIAVRAAVAAIKAAYAPEGVNVGMNLGRSAGAGITGHLHVHCLPRWSGDTNFMTSIANTRVLPEELTESWRKLREAWPEVS